MKRVFIIKIFAIWFLLITSSIAFAASQQTSSTDASVIITRARSYINEPTAIFWSDAELLTWLNDGIMDIVAKSHCLEVKETIGLVVQTFEYPVTEDYIKVKKVVYVDTVNNTEKGLLRVSPARFGYDSDTGEPTYFYEWNGSLFVYPVEFTAGANVIWQDSANVVYVDTSCVKWVDLETVPAGIEAYLVQRKTAILASDTVPLPAICDDVLVMYIYAQAMYKDQRNATAMRVMANYNSLIERFKEDFND